MGTMKVMEPMKDVHGYLSYDEVMRLINMGCPKERDKVLLMTLFYTGRRTSEVVGPKGITPRDISKEDALIYFNILKKKTPRKKAIPVSSKLVNLLVDYCERKGIEPDAKIFPITRQRVFQIIRRAGKTAGLEIVGNKRIHPHILRHSFAVHMARIMQDPADIVMIKNMLQHSSIDTTMFYLIFSPDEQRQLLERAFGEPHERGNEPTTETKKDSVN